MTAREYKDVRRPVITIALANRANAELFKRMVGNDVHLQDALLDQSDGATMEVDLIVADTASLQRYRERILHLRQRAYL